MGGAMRIGRFTLSGVSVALLVVQLGLVSTIAAKYLYQRWRCPRVWTRAAAYDPEMPMRGRYLSMQLKVDGCQSTLPSAKEATFPRDVSGAIRPGPFVLRPRAVYFSADLKVENDRLEAIRIQDPEAHSGGQQVSAMPGARCEDMRLETPVDFYIADTAQSAMPLKADQELWIEVTVPPKGPPRPIQLALKQGGAWRPLGMEK
jgi:hypothetical protein